MSKEHLNKVRHVQYNVQIAENLHPKP